ncbi:NmrA family protein [Melanomma pulvis-pyrius CBS 109.77]|uniref:NmrA family protein n=1 Tax=Melanomma pulvis-pyrius CBS 109.77 TaxID=1314802 RepID=A0A6A6WTR5_9PLEO|nr:NmrA family protein [Melanomma pulvis-pyrius CBS 109.77]
MSAFIRRLATLSRRPSRFTTISSVLVLTSGATYPLYNNSRDQTSSLSTSRTLATNMASTKAILITGATGKQGGSVLSHLAAHPSSPQYTLLAVTRDSASPSALKLAERHPNVQLVQGDLNNVPALFDSAKSALKEAGKEEKIWGVYSVQVSMGPGVTVETEVVQGCALIDESIKHGVSHFVYSSVDRGGNEKSFENQTPIPHFQSKYQIEKHLLEKAGKKGEKMGWTILRPVAFMDNLAPGMQTKVFLTALRDALHGKSLQWISVEDIGLFATKAFREPQEWNARAEGLAGDDLTFEELNACFERVTGYGAPTTYGVFGSVLLWAVTELKTMITWFATDGYGVDVNNLRRKEKTLCDFETWLKERSAFSAKH